MCSSRAFVKAQLILPSCRGGTKVGSVRCHLSNLFHAVSALTPLYTRDYAASDSPKVPQKIPRR